VISRGQGVVLRGLKPPLSLAYGPDLKGHAYDPEEARALYEESGHTGTMTLSVIQRDPDTQIAQIVQSMLAQAGMTLQIEVLERQAWVDRALARNLELGILQATLPRADPDISLSTYYSRTARANYGGIEHDRLHDLMDIARAETDPEVRRAHYVEAQQILLDNYYQTYFLWRPAREVARKELRGYAREFGGSWRYDLMWLDQ
jgi:peptide/nickel transport system substrate-binding protein